MTDRQQERHERVAHRIVERVVRKGVANLVPFIVAELNGIAWSKKMAEDWPERARRVRELPRYAPYYAHVAHDGMEPGPQMVRQSPGDWIKAADVHDALFGELGEGERG